MHRHRISRIVTIVALLLNVPALAWAACETYSGTVGGYGPSDNLYINTPVWACVSDANGRCTPSGGYLDLENFSASPVSWSSLAAGEPLFRPLAAHEKLVRYLPIYRRPGEELRPDLTIVVCSTAPPTPQPGGGSGGGGGNGGGGNGGGGTVPGGSTSTPDTYFIDMNVTFSNDGESRYHGFTLFQNTTFDVRFVADYTAQAALIPEAQLANFTGGLGFSGYAIFDGKIGTKPAITLPPGKYYAAVRNRMAGSNTSRFEIDFRIATGGQFLGWDIGATEMVQPRGGRAWHPFSLTSGGRYFIDGCNTGVETYIIPNSEIDHFTAGRQFRYYADYSAVDDNAAPGLWEVNLPAGTYWLVFRNQDSIAHAVTFQAERWSRPTTLLPADASSRDSQSTSARPHRDELATTEGLQAAWLERSALLRLEFSQHLDAAALTPAQFKIALGDTTLSAARVDYDPDRRIVTLLVPELRGRTGSPAVSWQNVRTGAGAMLAGSTDPLETRQP